MHIHWLSPCSLEDPQQVYQTPFASLRLRAGALVSVADQHLTVSIGEQMPSKTDLCVVGKIGTHELADRQSKWLQSIYHFKGPVVLDYTDDHIQHTTAMSDFYQIALERTDRAVCSSHQLKNSLQTVFHKPTDVIADAIEYSPLKPTPAHQSPKTLLWFGHASNIPSLLDFLKDFSPPIPVDLLALTSNEGHQLLQRHPTKFNKSVRLLFKHWSIEEMPKVAVICDMCIIPSDLSSSAKRGVSANRLLTALTLGLPTSADLLPAYLGFREYFADIQTHELMEMIDQPAVWHKRVTMAQNLICQKFSFQSLGQQWKNSLLNLSPV